MNKEEIKVLEEYLNIHVLEKEEGDLCHFEIYSFLTNPMFEIDSLKKKITLLNLIEKESGFFLFLPEEKGRFEFIGSCKKEKKDEYIDKAIAKLSSAKNMLEVNLDNE